MKTDHPLPGKNTMNNPTALLALLVVFGINPTLPAIDAVSDSRSVSAGDNGGFYLKDGDRVVFYGDSITEQRLYSGMTELFVVTRFPKLNVEFTHSGWGGDTVSKAFMGGGRDTLDVRLQRDVLAHKPTVMTVMLGMNDGHYQPFDQATHDNYTNGYAYLLDTVQKGNPGIRFTLIGPSPYDDITRPAHFEGGYNAVLKGFVAFVAKTSDERRQTFADFNSSLCDVLDKARQKDPQTAQAIIGDRVHPGAAGHLIMAETLLKAWNAPTLVSRVEIDGGKMKTMKSENTVVTDLSGTKGISWKQEDAALPFPIDQSLPEIRLVVGSSDVFAALDQEILKVTNLPGEAYTLRIDGDPVGAFSVKELGEGINLAAFQTPMWKQAWHVYDLTKQRMEKHFSRWRTLQVSIGQDPSPLMQTPEIKQALQILLKALDQENEDLRRQQHEASQPRPHVYQLEPVLPQQS
jgi:hypothetical protein